LKKEKKNSQFAKSYLKKSSTKEHPRGKPNRRDLDEKPPSFSIFLSIFASVLIFHRTLLAASSRSWRGGQSIIMRDYMSIPPFDEVFRI
jgi:hypothetical protein